MLKEYVNHGAIFATYIHPSQYSPPLMHFQSHS